MGSNQSIEALMEWLEADNAKERPERAERLQDLLDILPVPPEGISFLGGEGSIICFEEIRRCYMDGFYLAVVLLCLTYVERELAAHFYAAGWEQAKKARLAVMLERAYEEGVLSELEWQTYCDLANLRNSHAHFRSPREQSSLLARTVEKNALPREILKEDARKAILAMAIFMRHQSGRRVSLGSPDE